MTQQEVTFKWLTSYWYDAPFHSIHIVHRQIRMQFYLYEQKMGKIRKCFPACNDITLNRLTCSVQCINRIYIYLSLCGCGSCNVFDVVIIVMFRCHCWGHRCYSKYYMSWACLMALYYQHCHVHLNTCRPNARSTLYNGEKRQQNLKKLYFNFQARYYYKRNIPYPEHCKLKIQLPVFVRPKWI